MEPSFFKEAPKFKTPEEELEYLRAHIAKREAELVRGGQVENAKDNAVMEELLGIVITKGIRNALSVVEAMGSPHIEDDFHRILIQYLKTDQTKLDFKEGTPMYKSLNMTLFEITLPPPTDEADKSKGFKEFI